MVERAIKSVAEGHNSQEGVGAISLFLLVKPTITRGRMRSSKCGSKTVNWLLEAWILLVLVLCILASTCNAHTGMLDWLKIRNSRVQSTEYGNDLTVTTLRITQIKKGSTHVLDTKARGEIIDLLKQALEPAWVQNKLGFEFFSGSFQGKNIFIFRSTKTDSLQRCQEIFSALESEGDFKTPLFYVSLKESNDYFLGYMIQGTEEPLPRGVVKKIEDNGVKKLSPKVEKK